MRSRFLEREAYMAVENEVQAVIDEKQSVVLTFLPVLQFNAQYGSSGPSNPTITLSAVFSPASG